MQLHSPSRYTSAPSAVAAGALPIRARRPFDTDANSDPDPDLASPTPKPPNMVRRRPLAFHFLMAKSKTPPPLCASARDPPVPDGRDRFGTRLPFRM